MPYPGSPIYREIFGTSIRDDHWQKMNGMNFFWTAEGLTQEQLDRDYRRILTSFYRQPRVQHHYARFTLRHPHHLLRLGRFLGGMLAAKLRRGVNRLLGRQRDALPSLE